MRALFLTFANPWCAKNAKYEYCYRNGYISFNFPTARIILGCPLIKAFTVIHPAFSQILNPPPDAQITSEGVDFAATKLVTVLIFGIFCTPGPEEAPVPPRDRSAIRRLVLRGPKNLPCRTRSRQTRQQSRARARWPRRHLHHAWRNRDSTSKTR